MPGGYVTITDNADPMDVVVYRTREPRRTAAGWCAACRVFTQGRERHRELADRRRAAR